MSADQMRKMLEQLMGPQDEQAANRHFSDSDVCRPFLLGICLHDLFTNTREDLGACSKIHSEAMRGDYEKASQKADYNMEEEVLEYLMDFISKNEKRIVSNKKRLEAEESPELEQKAKEIHEVGIQIGEKLAKAEALGNDGKVDESLAMMAEVEQLKRRRKQAEDDYRASLPLSSNQQQKLRACDVCGAFLSLYDNDRRPQSAIRTSTQRLRPCEICGAFLGMYDKDTVLADHFGGKLHLGFVAIREKITELEEKIKAKVERRRSEREVNHSSEDRRGSRRSGASRRSRSRDRDQDRDRVRDRDRDRERDRDKDRERDRDRDRDRDRERRSHRSRSRERSRRNRSRSRDRDRHRRSRSRSRERRRRSRSRSRERRRRSRSQEEKSRHRRSRS